MLPSLTSRRPTRRFFLPCKDHPGETHTLRSAWLALLTCVTLAAGTAGAETPPPAASPSETASSLGPPIPETPPDPHGGLFPWETVGLDERQAAVHLLNRLTFGPRPGDLDAVVEMGITNWIERQLSGDSAGSRLEAALAQLPVMALDVDGLTKRYPHHAFIVSEAIAAGEMERSAYLGHDGPASRKRAEKALDTFARARGYQPQAEVLWQLQSQKLYHALLSEAQLREVLTDFWFNHFNVAARGEVRTHVVSYENDAIRPRVFGDFNALLTATAQHPAMLFYLGNVRSVAERSRATPFDDAMEGFEAFSPGNDPGLRQRLKENLPWYPPDKRTRLPKTLGLNENYARELLELHTLGVQGGYSQDDVVEVARAFTGWTVLPQSPSRQDLRELLTEASERRDLGFVVDGEFTFRPDQHDGESKSVLGRQLPAGRGIEDGMEVLQLVAAHPSTATHLARKLATRFVADDPPETLVRRLATTFQRTEGDLREVMRTLIDSPEFWHSAIEGQKLKTPFELVVSALRALDAEVDEPKVVMYWVSRAGQSNYLYGAPTGFDDDENTWVDADSMLQRINFALALARGRISGVRFDRLGLLAGLEPLSLEDTVATLIPAVLPERFPEEVLADLAGLNKSPSQAIDPLEGDDSPRAAALREARLERNTTYALAVLLASPEFQYR